MNELTFQETLWSLAETNVHVHTIYSPCASPHMTPSAIIAAADRLGVKALILTDHHHPGDRNLRTRHASLCAEIAKLTCGKVKVTVGAELSAHGLGLFSDDWSDSCDIPYRLYACNHYHHRKWEHPKNNSAEAYKEHTLAVIHRLIPSGRATCIAHPFVGSYLTARFNDPTLLTRAYTDNDLAGVCEAARRHNVALEINTRHLLKDMEFARRFLRIGFETRAPLHLGTDAHSPMEIDPRPQVKILIAELKCK